MAQAKDVLVITSSKVEGYKIDKYIKPITAHIVAGTNFFSDFLGGLADVFGGRSNTYQKQLSSLYKDAIEQLRVEAFELGANCIIDFKVDMDEISGKGKSMFMLTAIGTAVIIDKDFFNKPTSIIGESKLDNISSERLNALQVKKKIIDLANSNQLVLNDDTWSFLINNEVIEIFPFLIKQLELEVAKDITYEGRVNNFDKPFIGYIDSLSDNNKIELLYNSLKEIKDEPTFKKLISIMQTLKVFDFKKINELLNNDSFDIKKRGVAVSNCEKPSYDKQDLNDLIKLKETILKIVVERGTRTTKKQMLSSKEKEVWSCECGKTNDIDSYCLGCHKDIYGFKETEGKPFSIIDSISQKIDIISNCLE
jgi:uncharacterized protein YbjQ (UPF0145 family)